MKKQLFSLLFVAITGSAVAQTGAIMQYQSGTLDKAKTEIDKFLQDEKNAAKAKSWLVKGQIYEGLAIDQTGMYGKLDSMAAITAHESYKKAIDMDSPGGKEGKVAKEAKEYLAGQKLYAGLMTQGAAKYQNKNFPDAYKLMSLANDVNPKDTTSALYTGIVAQQMKNNDKAMEYFGKFLAHGGKDPAIYYTMSVIYREQKKDKEALEILDKGIAVNPTNKDLQNEKVNMLLASGNTEAAITNLKASVEKDPSNVQNVLNLGILYNNVSDGATDEIRKLNRSIEEADNPGAKAKLASQKGKYEAYDEEIKRLTDKIKKDPKTAAASKKSLGDVTKMRDAEKATYDQMVADAAAKPASAVNVEEVKKKIADLETKKATNKTLALDYYDRALKLEPDNYDANFNAGVLYFNEGVDVKHKVDGMDVKTYQTEGKVVEAKAVEAFKKAMPYFEKGMSIRQDNDLKENLRNLYNLLKQAEKSDAYDAKMKALDK